MPKTAVGVDVTPSTSSTTWAYGDDASSSGDITITADSIITFKMKNASGWDWASPPLTWQTAPAAGIFTTPTIDPQNKNKFSLEDTNSDGTTTGVSHSYCLHATYGGVTYSTDPRVINR